jgi:OOP family OmpA-OmpF porin
MAQIRASMPKTLMIYFEFDKVKFKTDPQTEMSITGIKNWLGKYPESTITVTGHTDLVGTPEYNQELGLRRARVIQEYLTAQGLPPEKITAISKGETQPIGDYLTEEGRAMNRRTEISIKMQ